MSRRPNLRQKPATTPLTAAAERPRLTLLPGLEDASGEPLVAIATGHPRRPVLRMFVGMAAALAELRAMGVEGGAL
jgi:hypothetical protein